MTLVRCSTRSSGHRHFMSTHLLRATGAVNRQLHQIPRAQPRVTTADGQTPHRFKQAAGSQAKLVLPSPTQHHGTASVNHAGPGRWGDAGPRKSLLASPRGCPVGHLGPAPGHWHHGTRWLSQVTFLQFGAGPRRRPRGARCAAFCSTAFCSWALWAAGVMAAPATASQQAPGAVMPPGERRAAHWHPRALKVGTGSILEDERHRPTRRPRRPIPGPPPAGAA